jgi:hypothetical protein
VTGEQWLDILEAIDGPPLEWWLEAAREFAGDPEPTYAERDQTRNCPFCGRKMPRRVRHDHVHYLLPSLDLACDAPGRVRSSADTSEVTCSSCVISILRERLAQ